MKSLFIIGNGFDLDHKLPTSYEHFREYLQKTYAGLEDMSPSYSISSTLMPDGEEVYVEKEVASFLMDIISRAEGYGDWKDVEASLGKLDFEEYLGEMAYLLDDDNDEGDLMKRVARNEDASLHFYRVTIKIKDIFSKWIDSISLRGVNAKKSFQNLIDRENDIFLTFNYTRVLEEIYETEDVFHIHGEQGGPIVIGHGEFRDEEFYNRYIGSEEHLEEIHEALRKDTNAIIFKSSYFFKELKDIDSIFTYGFSFSNVDIPYLKVILKRLSTDNVTWYLNDYDREEKREEYKEKMKSCGFKGKFATFTCKE
ncbi:bacteriophage abortive infection AbiH family protein [Bacillus sp. ISL-53]|nr:bacteriophage abortive infection AbiH family protein [Bacillus sp. ISL-53]